MKFRPWICRSENSRRHRNVDSCDVSRDGNGGRRTERIWGGCASRKNETEEADGGWRTTTTDDDDGSVGGDRVGWVLVVEVFEEENVEASRSWTGMGNCAFESKKEEDGGRGRECEGQTDEGENEKSVCLRVSVCSGLRCVRCLESGQPSPACASSVRPACVPSDGRTIGRALGVSSAWVRARRRRSATVCPPQKLQVPHETVQHVLSRLSALRRGDLEAEQDGRTSERARVDRGLYLLRARVVDRTCREWLPSSNRLPVARPGSIGLRQACVRE
ncbi:hypothetical protein GGR57DRAFT_128538 [Xylariaceae sp. FL1272]|nr:hypothetical protein GGR57DRAFT_128538 [Xylariaceae sp. FL1272]